MASLRVWVLLLSTIVYGCAGRANNDASTPENGDTTNGSTTNSGTGIAGASTALGSTGTPGAGGTTGGSTGSACTLTCPLTLEEGEPICECKRETPECTADTDCELATNLGACCFQQRSAYPVSLVETEPCLDQGKGTLQGCPAPDCSAATCDTPVMLRIMYAACDAGLCVAREECPEHLVEENGVCAPRCMTDDDCVLASRVDGCCPNSNCTMPMNRVRLTQDDCIVEAGGPVPDKCLPEPDDCLNVDCDSSGCLVPQAATCSDDGVCVSGAGG